MRLFGVSLIVFSALVPLPWFIGYAPQHGPITSFSLYVGVLALILMSEAQIFATRLRGLETLFGGLDQIYVLHKWIGILSLIFMFLHDTLEADIKGPETALTELGEGLGEWGYNGFIVLILISLITLVPYSWWRYTHKLMGAFYALCAAHFFLINKPFTLTDPMGLYVGAFCILGILAYLYALVPSLHRRHDYEISAVTTSGKSLAIEMRPTGNGTVHRAGQFAFFKFEGRAEPHPFTISSAPKADRSLRITVRGLGDYTKSLPTHLQVGQKVSVDGAYGRFKRPLKSGAELWIAGGIGITPFIAWAGALEVSNRPIHLFYAVKDEMNAAHLDEIQVLAAQHSNLTLHLYFSSAGKRLTATEITNIVETPLSHCDVAFCGPKAMRDDLKADLVAHGLPKRRFHSEEFEIRNDAGLSRLLFWLYGKIAIRVHLLPDESRIRTTLAGLKL